MSEKTIPYKIYLKEDEIPEAWYNMRADMKKKPAPLLNPGTLEPLKAEEQIKKADKQRASYYNYYATGTWGDVDNYDLCVDTGALGINGAVELIACCAALMEKRAVSKDQDVW